MTRNTVLLLIALLLGGAILVAPPSLVRYSAVFVLLWLLPGLAWVHLISAGALDHAEELVVGLGLSFVITPLITLVGHYLPGPLERPTLLGLILGVIAFPWAVVAVMRFYQRNGVTTEDVQDNDRAFSELRDDRSAGDRSGGLWRSGWAWLLAAVVIATVLRITNLGYSEFQGDEAVVMVRAAQALGGDEAIIFQHRKGPAELTAVMSTWRLAGTTNEWMARLPFAWASILGVVAVFLFGRRLNRPHAGGIAACLLAIEGFRVGFGRIVQYQSIVFLLSTLALLCLLIYHARGHWSLLTVAAAFFAGGALAHYDALLVLPAGLLLVVARMWQERTRFVRVAGPVIAAGLVGLLLLGLFYYPFWRSSYVESTSSYVSGRVGSGQLLQNNLWDLFELSAVYNSVYFLALMAFFLAMHVVVTWGRWGRVGYVLASATILVAGTTLLRPEWWGVGDLTAAVVPSAVLLIGALLAPGQQIGVRSVWLWLGVPALFYLFFVALPLTHIHMAFPAWAMLVGLGVADMGRWLAARSRPVLRVASGFLGGLFVLSAMYSILVFVDHSPEYRRTFPQSKHPLFWTPYEQMPEAGLFGFPYRAGWKVVGWLVDEGRLNGSYDSNEELDVTDFYMRRAVRLSCASPDFYVTARNVQDEVSVGWKQIESEYQPSMEITVAGEPKMTVYERGVPGLQQTYAAEAFAKLFDSGSRPERYGNVTSLEAVPIDLDEFTPRDAQLGSFVRVVGYKVDARHAAPGGYVELTLLWEVLASVPVDYHVFTHLHDGEVMQGQLDGQPVCGNLPTSLWRTGQYIVDPYRIPISPDASPGAVPLTVGMYDFATMQRLQATASDGSFIGDNVYVTDIEIQAP